MTYIIKDLLQQLNSESAIILADVENNWPKLHPQTLLADPAPGAWSAIACLDHLNTYSRYYLPAIEKALEKAHHSDPPVTFRSGWLGNYFYKLMLVDNNGLPKKKMSAPKNSQPDKNLDAMAVLKEFIYQQNEISRLLSLAQRYDCNRIKIPVAIMPFIKLRLGDTFLFYTAHIRRHISQAQRALQATGQTISVNTDRLLS